MKRLSTVPVNYLSLGRPDFLQAQLAIFIHLHIGFSFSLVQVYMLPNYSLIKPLAVMVRVLCEGNHMCKCLGFTYFGTSLGQSHRL